MSIFIQEVLGLLNSKKQKTTLISGQDYIELGRLSVSSLNRQPSYSPKMEPFIMKMSDFIAAVSGGSGVTSFNTLTGAINLVGGTNVTLGTVGNSITINAAGGGVSSIIAGTNTTISPATGLGDVTINADNGLNGGNSKLKIYGGVCINTAGTWSLLNDASHTFLNLTSATTVSNRLQVNYPTVGKVISFTCTPDETYAQNGISVGASVGLSSSTLYLYRDNIVDYISWNGSAFTSATGQVTGFTYASGVLKLAHGTLISPDTFSLSIEGRSGTTNYRYVWTSLLSNRTDVQILNPDGSNYTGAATTDMRFSFARGGEVEVSAADSAISSSNIWVQAIMELA